jgi:predicted dehydrogenase
MLNENDIVLGVCIIGCGFMGRLHADAWLKRGDAKVVAVYNRSAAAAKVVQDQTGAIQYESYEKAILHQGVDVVSICVPTCLHEEISCFAMENGRHVIVEKPIALTKEQAERMIETAKRNNVKLCVSYQYRGMPRHRRYRELFRRGDFGSALCVRFVDIREVRSKLAMHEKSVNGGPIIDLCGHYFDLMRFYTGEEPEEVWAKGYIFGKGKKRLESISDFAVDAADILVSMTGGHTLSVFVNWGMPEGSPTIEYELLSGSTLTIQHSNSKVIANYSDHREIWEDFRDGTFGPAVRIEDIAKAIREDGEVELTGDEAKKALLVSLAALESIRTGEVVNL